MVYCVFIKWHGKGLEIGIFFFFFPNNNVSCRDVRPNRIYWAWGPIGGHEVVQGGVNIIRGVHVSKGIG